jgi:hypothetical protein
VAAGRGVLHHPRPPGVPGRLGLGRRPAPISVRHAKSNGIDADTLARLPLLAPASLQPLELPGAEVAALDRRVRACDRLTRQGAVHQRRIKDLVRQLMPLTPLTGELTKTDLAVLERWADPRTLLAAGPARLLARITKTSHGRQGAARAEAWRDAAQAAVELYGEHRAPTCWRR